MAGFIRRFGGRDATRVARTAIEVAACQQRDDLVPDQVVSDLLIPVVATAATAGGYILDGFPTTLPQAITAAELGAQLDLTLDAAMYLHVPEPVLVQQLLAWVRPEVIRHRLNVTDEEPGADLPGPQGKQEGIAVGDVARPERRSDRPDLIPGRDVRGDGLPCDLQRGMPGRGQVGRPQPVARRDEQLADLEVSAVARTCSSRGAGPVIGALPLPLSWTRSRSTTVSMPASSGSSVST